LNAKVLKVTEHNSCKRGDFVKYRISICILLCLAILASGQAAAQQFGTKVQAGDPDVGLPLSTFSLVGIPTQNIVGVAYWDIGSSPNIYDDKDVAYLQFGNIAASAPGVLKAVRANDIRLTGWGSYPAGSYVKAGDSDMGQWLIPQAAVPPLAPATGFYYMDAVGGAGYDIGDPVYLKVTVTIPPLYTHTNDVRITPNAGFSAGSRVSLSDPDATKPLVAFEALPLFGAGGGPVAQFPGPFSPFTLPVARLMFFNGNGNAGVAGAPIYDDGDVVYFDVAPLNIVSPNDVRMY